jgi:hypothetical protein
MKLAVSGTYSAGKTLTVMALSHYTGVPRTLARSIREILPDAVPGKTLAECTPAEYLQLALRRHCSRAVQEARLPGGFISDGSSLQEWIYGAVRVRYGMNPSATASRSTPIPRHELPPEMRFFEEVVAQFGWAFKQHVKATYDVFVHLRNELPLADDGHRPMNERFRSTCDEMLLAALDELAIPYRIVGGTLEERLVAIASGLDLRPVRSLSDAVARAGQEYAQLDVRLETQRPRAVRV